MKRPQYTPEFQDEAVRQVLDGQETLARIARNLSIRDNTLVTWKKTTRKGHGGPPRSTLGKSYPRRNGPVSGGRTVSCSWSKRSETKRWVSLRGHGEPLPVHSRAEQAVLGPC
ncbi:MAG: transposase [Armatimonadetes bacterium]|nr:transposase [Armatimonadota bacterium]